MALDTGKSKTVFSIKDFTSFVKNAVDLFKFPISNDDIEQNLIQHSHLITFFRKSFVFRLVVIFPR